MRLRTALATLSDVLRVISDMSEQTASDFRSLGMSADELLSFFANRVPEHDSVSFIEGGRPVIIMGWDKMANGWYSWFIATSEGFTTRATLAVRRHLRNVQRAHPDVDLFCIALLDTEKVRRWFKCLGCVRVDHDGVRVWRFSG